MNIRLGTLITKVAVAPDDSDVTLTTQHDETLTCSAVVITVPLGILKSEMIQFDPPLPRPKLEALRNFGIYFCSVK